MDQLQDRSRKEQPQKKENQINREEDLVEFSDLYSKKRVCEEEQRVSQQKKEKE